MVAFGLILLAILAGSALIVWRALNPPPLLRINDRGILDRRLALGWLEWNTIEGAYRPRCPDGERLVLRVRVDERLRRRLGRRTTEGQPLPRRLELPLRLGGTPYTEVEVLQQIMARQAAAAADVPPHPPADRTRIPCS